MILTSHILPAEFAGVEHEGYASAAKPGNPAPKLPRRLRQAPALRRATLPARPHASPLSLAAGGETASAGEEDPRLLLPAPLPGSARLSLPREKLVFFDVVEKKGLVQRFSVGATDDADSTRDGRETAPSRF